jgi:competence protein ComEC
LSDRSPVDGEVLDVRLVPAGLTCWAVTAAGILRPLGPFLAAGFALTAAVLLAVRFRRRDLRARLSAGLLVICLVGAGFGVAITLRANHIRGHPAVSRFGTVTEVTVTPTEGPRPFGSGRLMFRAELDMIGPDHAEGRVTAFASGMAFADAAAGKPMRFRARVSAPWRRDLSVATLTAVGEPVMGSMSAVQRVADSVRRGFADAARGVLPADQAAMLPALVLGDTAALTGETSARFRTAGLTHLTAVSGANVTIVCGAVLFAAGTVGPRIAVTLAAAALVAFVVVVGPTASVLRAAVMGGIALLAIVTSRRRQAVPALAATVILLMIVAPQLAVDAGFALSVFATAALVVWAPGLSRRMVRRGWPKAIADAVCVSAAAQLMTAPMIAGLAGSVSLVAIAANLLVAPVIAPITVLGTAAAALSVFWAGLAQLVIRFTGPELWWLLAVARLSAGIPGATVPVPRGAAGMLVVGFAVVAAALLWRTRWRRGAGVVAGALVLAWSIADWLARAGHGPAAAVIGS